ncbi:hypothetical protein FPV67DRAFT_743681 [Lyophyllum atratum]|nr:hypothetical protein FPV67DRAFT_743681 [Lyophyllum atratum]
MNSLSSAQCTALTFGPEKSDRVFDGCVICHQLYPHTPTCISSWICTCIYLKTEQNHVTVTGLINVLDQDSLRVEGHGAATIHDVTISCTPRPTPPTTSPGLTVLQSKKAKTLKALERCKKSITALESYLATMHSQHVDVMQVGNVVKEYEATAGELDNRVSELEKELSEVEEELAEEQKKLGGKALDDHLGI